MSSKNSSTKTQFHPRNKHRGQYDFKRLVESFPDLATFVIKTPYGSTSIDFFNPAAVLVLNKALLKLHYNISFWEIPSNYLCPPIPGRADYIHHVADLLGKDSGEKITCLDLGVGASCVYPIIGVAEYNWSFIGSDIDKIALASSQKIIDNNPSLNDKVELRLQANPNQLLKGIIKPNEKIDLIVCNPPFHASAAEASAAAQKKSSNLKKQKVSKPVLNFGGQQHELWCKGGEFQFVKILIQESAQFAKNCSWFTTLISKKETLKHMLVELEKIGKSTVKIIELKTGNKISRVLCWRFLNKQ
ncbi:MAG: 23S rRNA (adenine(1618)-N(6))-methyltransferase RlmF [Vicingaceae bacterium]